MSILTVTAKVLTKSEKAVFDIHITPGFPHSLMVFNPWMDGYKNIFGKRPKPIGHGQYAAVYAHPTNKRKVIKVVHNPDKCWDIYLSIISKITKP